MKGFRMQTITNVFAVILICANIYSILGQSSKRNYSKAEDELNLISPSSGIRKNNTGLPTGLESNAIKFQNISKTQPTTELQGTHENLKTSNNSNDSILWKSFPHWEFIERFKDSQLSMSDFAFLLILMALSVITLLTCILKCCCFFWKRKGYTGIAGESSLWSDVEDGFSISSDFNQDFCFEGCFGNEE